MHGETLITRAIHCARRSGVCTQILVTSDDPAVRDNADREGIVALVRPAELATDTAPLLPTLQHALSRAAANVDVVLLLSPTSPLRTPLHLRTACAWLAADQTIDSVVTVSEVPAAIRPARLVTRGADGRLAAYEAGRSLDDTPRRQDARPAYARNGLVYAVRADVLRGGSLYGAACQALVTHPDTHCTIDTEADWHEAEARIR